MNQSELEDLIRLTNFGNPDGSINWEKLVRYNSGKEQVKWISRK